MSKYLVNKFLFTVDRDPDLVERYRSDPAGTVAWWEAECANEILGCPGLEKSTWLSFEEPERRALGTVAADGQCSRPCFSGKLVVEAGLILERRFHTFRSLFFFELSDHVHCLHSHPLD